MRFSNVYDDERARAYAKLEFPGTYYLAFRDLPALIAEHVRGRVALDFGCGTGRSTRFLSELGFDVTGIDIAPSMIDLAGNDRATWPHRDGLSWPHLATPSEEPAVAGQGRTEER